MVKVTEDPKASLGVGQLEDRKTCIFLQTGDIILSVETSWGQKIVWEDLRQKSWKALPELNGTGTLTYTGDVDGEVTMVIVTGITCGTPKTPTATPTQTPTSTPTATPTQTPTTAITRVICQESPLTLMVVECLKLSPPV